MKAPVGAEVGLYYDSPRPIGEGDYLQTPTGRTYLILSVRVQARGQHAGRRKHLRAVVIDASDIDPAGTIHPLHWYKRN